MFPIVAHSAFTVIVVLNYIQTTSKCSLLGNLSLPTPPLLLFPVAGHLSHHFFMVSFSISQPGPLAPHPTDQLQEQPHLSMRIISWELLFTVSTIQL